jgi:uncharacterized protein
VGIRVLDNPQRERYEVLSDDQPAGFIRYTLGEGTIALLHIEIDARFEGRGLTVILIQGILDDVRRRGRAVLPYCPLSGDLSPSALTITIWSPLSGVTNSTFEDLPPTRTGA